MSKIYIARVLMAVNDKQYFISAFRSYESALEHVLDLELHVLRKTGIQARFTIETKYESKTHADILLNLYL